MVSTRGIKHETPTCRRPRKSNANNSNAKSGAASTPAHNKQDAPNKAVKAEGNERKSGRERSAPVKFRDDDPTNADVTTQPTAARKNRKSETMKGNTDKTVAGNKRKAVYAIQQTDVEVKVERGEERKPKRIRISLKKIKQPITSTKQPDTTAAANGAKVKSETGKKEVRVKISIGSKIKKETAQALVHFPMLGHKTADGGKSTKAKAATYVKTEKSPASVGRDVTVAIRIDEKLSKKTCVASFPSVGRDSKAGKKTTPAVKEENNTMADVKVLVRSDSKLIKKSATASIPAANAGKKTATTVKEENNAMADVKVLVRSDSKLSKKRATASLPATVTSNTNIQAQISTPIKEQPNDEDLTSPDADALLAAMFTATGGNTVKKKKQKKATTQKRENNSIRCKFEGCNRYRQGYTGGYCLQHKQFGTGVCVADLKQQMKSPVVGDALQEPKGSNAMASAADDDTKVPAPLHATRAAMKPAAKDVNPEPLPPVEDTPESDENHEKTPQDSKQCIVEGCTRYKRSRNGGYCLTHKHLWDGIEPEPVIKIAPIKSQCRVEGCVRYKRSNNGGYCLTHKHLFKGNNATATSAASAAAAAAGMSSLPPLPGGVAGDIPHFHCVDHNLDHDLSALPNFDGLLDHDPTSDAEDEMTTAYAASALSYLGMGMEMDNAASASLPSGDALIDAIGPLPGVDTSISSPDEVTAFQSETMEAEDNIAIKGLGVEAEQSVTFEHRSSEGTRKDPPENYATAKESEEPVDENIKLADVTTNGCFKHPTDKKTNAPDAKGQDEESRKDPPENLSMHNESNEDTSDDSLDPSHAAAAAAIKPPLQAKQPESDLLPIIPEGIEIEPKRKDNKGRYLCKVVGCKKLDQSANKGFCRSHYNIIYSGLDQSNNPVEPWMCTCGLQVGGRQKRCSGCFRWKDGKRQPYNTVMKKNNSGDTEIYSTDAEKTESRTVTNASGFRFLEEFWTCSECGNEVEEQKSRCGNCHHWRGGKRQGGWKLGEKKAIDIHCEDDDIDRSTDWECCGEIIPAKKTRCGKCRGWRGGKRQIRWSYQSVGDEEIDDVEDRRNDVDTSIDWICPKCDHVNKGPKKRCGSCSTWRFPRKSVEDDSASIDGGHWICKACSYDNFSTEVKCLMCQKKRPNWKKYAKSLPSSSNVMDEMPSENTITSLNEANLNAAGSAGVTAVDGFLNEDGNAGAELTKTGTIDENACELTTKDLANLLPEVVNKNNESHQLTKTQHDLSHNSNDIHHHNNDIGFGSHANFSSPNHEYLQSSPNAGQNRFDYTSSYLHTDFLNAHSSTDYLTSNNPEDTAKDDGKPDEEGKPNDESLIADNIVQV